jgi:DNA-binding NtrC family response regulator
MERAVLLADGRAIDVEAIPPGGEHPNGVWSDVPDDAAALAERKQVLRSEAVERVERLFVLKALRAAGWNVSQAARNVGMARPNLHALMRKHGVTSPEPDGEAAEGETPSPAS